MELPEYVTVEEVRRVCRELALRDWTAMEKPDVRAEEARTLLKEIGADGMGVDLEDFRAGLEVELEHGFMYPEANVTNNHPVLTARIVLAHLKETLDYYKRLEVAELEGDLLKAMRRGDAGRAVSLQKDLVRARYVLQRSEAAELGEL